MKQNRLIRAIANKREMEREGLRASFIDALRYYNYDFREYEQHRRQNLNKEL